MANKSGEILGRYNADFFRAATAGKMLIDREAIVFNSLPGNK